MAEELILGSTMKQLKVVIRVGLEPGTVGFEVQRLNHLSGNFSWLLLDLSILTLQKLLRFSGVNMHHTQSER